MQTRFRLVGAVEPFGSSQSKVDSRANPNALHQRVRIAYAFLLSSAAHSDRTEITAPPTGRNRIPVVLHRTQGRIVK